MIAFKSEKKQSLRDIAIQLYGSWEYVFKLANDNNLSIDSDITAGTELVYDETVGDQDVKNYLITEGNDIINPEVTIIVMEEFTFQTNKLGAFEPVITTGSYTATWMVSGEADQTTNTPSFSLDGSVKTVTLCIQDFSDIETINLTNQGIYSAFDGSDLIGCSEFRYPLNPDLTSVINPESTVNVDVYTINDTGIRTLDLSPIGVYFGGVFNASNCLSLTSITLPETTRNVNSLLVFNSNITGEFDMSPLQNLSGEINVEDNSKIRI